MEKNARIAYINNVRIGMALYANIENLKAEESINLKYAGLDLSITKGDKIEVSNGQEKATVDLVKSGKVYLYVYTTNMFGQVSHTRIPFGEIEYDHGAELLPYPEDTKEEEKTVAEKPEEAPKDTPKKSNGKGKNKKEKESVTPEVEAEVSEEAQL